MKSLRLFLAVLMVTALLPAQAWCATGAQSGGQAAGARVAPATPAPAPAPAAGAKAAAVPALGVRTWWGPGAPPPGWVSGSAPAGQGVVEGEVAHAKPPAPPPPPAPHRVLLRDGSVLLARDVPKLVGGTLRFADLRGTLVSVKASEVNLAATAAANHLTWGAAATAPAAPAGPAAKGSTRQAATATSRPAAPPH